jgi:hypothetical protein
MIECTSGGASEFPRNDVRVQWRNCRVKRFGVQRPPENSKPIRFVLKSSRTRGDHHHIISICRNNKLPPTCGVSVRRAMSVVAAADGAYRSRDADGHCGIGSRSGSQHLWPSHSAPDFLRTDPLLQRRIRRRRMQDTVLARRGMEATEAERAYNARHSTRVPVNPRIRVNSAALRASSATREGTCVGAMIRVSDIGRRSCRLQFR